jgi:glycosyltransferase involved in cell wall biosynthesis
MLLGIDASNIREGGGVTHLIELLRAVDPSKYGFERVIVWGGLATLSKIEERQWLTKVHEPLLEKLPSRIFWQRFKLKEIAAHAGCDLLFVPGGSDASNFKPMVTMSQNLLPFEWQELRRYGWSVMTPKLLLLRMTQSRTFLNAAGVIFLTKYAQGRVLKVIGDLPGGAIVIPHGIDTRFFMPPRPQRQFDEFNHQQPCRVMYVSIIDVYKHQWHVAKAVANLRAEGIPIMLDLIGPPGSAIERLENTLRELDPDSTFINYRGAVPYQKLHESYISADIGLFASSCETFGQILTEAMGAGLPIACSKLSAMPELLGESGVYFDPEQPNEIADAIRQLVQSAELRAKLAQSAYQKAQLYSWDCCARETFEFLSQIARNNYSSKDISMSNNS